MSDWHDCPMCGLEEVPVWRAMCGKCFPSLPWELRIAFQRAYRRRVFDQLGWQEMKIRGRQWWMENGRGMER